MVSATGSGGVERKRRGLGGWLVRWTRRTVAGVIILAALLVVGTGFRVWQVARVDNYTAVDAIVVLGAAQYNGVPTDVFQARLDQAINLYEAQVAPLVVTVGGKIEGDVYTEAGAGRTYLIENGIPEPQVLAVEEGNDTLGSVRAVVAALRDQGVDSVVVASDPWHSLRTQTMFRDAGLGATTAPTRSGPSVLTRESQLRGIVRETGALLYYQFTHSSNDFRYTPDQ